MMLADLFYFMCRPVLPCVAGVSKDRAVAALSKVVGVFGRVC